MERASLRRIRNAGIPAALIAELVVFSLISPYFFTPDNLLNVSLQSSITAIIAAGMTFVIITGGIDLSVGSLVALVGVIAASALKVPLPFGWAFLLALAAGLATGAASGAAAGAIITRFRIMPFIVTLAFMTMYRGLAFVLTEGRPVWELPPEFSLLASGRVAGIPVPTIIMIAVYAAAHTVLAHTPFGRAVYAVGGNADAARFSGINVNRVLVWVYVISGALAALSGILLAARINSGQPNAGLSYELDVIAAVAVGGTSLSGGKGTALGTLIGSFLIGVLRNGLNLLNVESYVQQVVVGAVILAAVMMDRGRDS